MASAAPTSSVEVRGLVVRRAGRTVLDGLDLVLRPGEVTGLLGPSGCGKTTLLRAIVGTQVVAAGTVGVLGEPAGSRALRSRIGYVTQAPSVYGDLTVEENLRFFARVLGAPRSRAAEVVAAVSLSDDQNRPVDALSEGQRSRTSLAVALLGRPDLLVLDEPTVGLDPVVRRDLWSLFTSYAASGATVLVSSHVMDEAERCDRLLLMWQGTILVDDTPAGICRRAGTADVESAFLAIVSAQGRP